MEGKLDAMLLKNLRDMGMEFMTPVQSKVLNMPSLQADWYADVYIACSMTPIRTDQMGYLAWCKQRQELARLLLSSSQQSKRSCQLLSNMDKLLF